MADVETDVTTAGQPKKRTFKKFSYRGVDLDALLDMSTDELVKLFNARPRRRFQRGLKRKPMALIKKLRKAKREAPPGEKPEPVKTHLRNMIIVPEMIGSIIGIYNGKTFNQIEVKPEMIGHYLAEFSISYKPVKHGRPGIGATHSSRIIQKQIEPVTCFGVNGMCHFGKVSNELDMPEVTGSSLENSLWQKCKLLHDALSISNPTSGIKAYGSKIQRFEKLPPNGIPHEMAFGGSFTDDAMLTVHHGAVVHERSPHSVLPPICIGRKNSRGLPSREWTKGTIIRF
ncbi:40S ribosomal protein S15 [Capsicum annuum]|nr:40S ribosomal protein S15 [Capsicum annuum]